MPPLLLSTTPASRCAGVASPSPACAGGSARPTAARSLPRLLHARRRGPSCPHAQVGEPSNKGRPASPTPGAPAPKGGSEGDAADAAAAAADAATAATDYAEGVARVAEEGMSSAGDVAYAARADAIAAERKAAETGGEDLSADDIRRLAALRRSGGAGTTSPGSSPADAAGGLLAGVLEEARLIEWPTLGRAAGDTAVVLAIVATSAALLFAINYALTELSSLIY